ncbi:MAG: hypothetical protein JNN17_09485 [Verrucomicrobiaceae bacterium]|nr:hypothetical protein [Verrucomicrobiaceae bacterium]
MPASAPARAAAESDTNLEKHPPKPAKVLHEEVEPVLDTYPQLLLDAMTYPWRRGGAYILVPGTFLAMAFAFSVWAPVLGLVSLGIGACFFSAFYLQIVESTIAGRHNLPDWPSFSDFYDDMLKPGFQMLVVFLMSGVVYAAVAWAVFSVFAFENDDSTVKMLRSLAEIVFGFYVPMGVLGLVLHGHAGGALPHRVIPAIFRCMPGYLIGVGTLAFINLLTNLLQDSVKPIPFAGILLGWLLTICLMVMQGRLTGTLGLRFARRITGV